MTNIYIYIHDYTYIYIHTLLYIYSHIYIIRSWKWLFETIPALLGWYWNERFYHPTGAHEGHMLQQCGNAIGHPQWLSRNGRFMAARVRNHWKCQDLGCKWSLLGCFSSVLPMFLRHMSLAVRTYFLGCFSSVSTILFAGRQKITWRGSHEQERILHLQKLGGQNLNWFVQVYGLKR